MGLVDVPAAPQYDAIRYPNYLHFQQDRGLERCSVQSPGGECAMIDDDPAAWLTASEVEAPLTQLLGWKSPLSTPGPVSGLPAVRARLWASGR